MSDRMRPIPFPQLMERMLTEFRNEGSVFGITKFHRANHLHTVELFGERMETPVGPAAGPHTQLAQNIVAAYLCGARFFELKTVQTLDGEDLPVKKPCILAEDEGYNVEWSTELRVREAMDEYIKAWFALKLLARELELGGTDGFIFNMSVGYDLRGIRSEKIDGFIEGLKDASRTEAWRACKEWTLANLEHFSNLDGEDVEEISPRVCRSITLSTLHGCPPDEIERIAGYLMREKRLHTYVKCNPTLLGYEFARRTLNNLGYRSVSFGEKHFKADLQWKDALPMLRRLSALAEERGVRFGVKLSNTLPVDVKRNELPGNEMYLSGRALFPLTVSLALRLTEAFGGKLPISYAGGASLTHIGTLFSAGLYPITLATDLLKPGGYQRLLPMAEKLSALSYDPVGAVDQSRLKFLAAEAMSGDVYRKAQHPAPLRKRKDKAPLFDCATAPCRSACPIGQDIPAYIRLMEAGRHAEALQVILRRNPLPHITGEICPHTCTACCTRGRYECPVDIRGAKLKATLKASAALTKRLKPPAASGMRVAVVGGGPGGIAAAHFLARSGAEVHVFEKRDALGGTLRYVIPDFRIPAARMDQDAALAKALGVQFFTGEEITSLAALRERGFEKVVLAVGAWKPSRLVFENGGVAENALQFLSRFKAEPEGLSLGKYVAVVGGGNTAMDTARAALRVPGVEHVSIIYRRTKREMPADEAEFRLAQADGVEFLELLVPLDLQDGVLTCRRMVLGGPDSSGRRAAVATHDLTEVFADTVIAAVGEQVDGALLRGFGVQMNGGGYPILNRDTLESGTPGVYVIGDARGGPATVVEAIRDAAICARAICGVETEEYASLNGAGDVKEALRRRTTLGAVKGPGRCLECATVCEICAEVCPNRANVAIEADGRRQVIHLDRLCNECGNCATFCPYDSSPYREKFTLFDVEEDFMDSEVDGFIAIKDGAFRARLRGKVYVGDPRLEESALPEETRPVLRAMSERYGYLL